MYTVLTTGHAATIGTNVRFYIIDIHFHYHIYNVRGGLRCC